MASDPTGTSRLLPEELESGPDGSGLMFLLPLFTRASNDDGDPSTHLHSLLHAFLPFLGREGPSCSESPNEHSKPMETVLEQSKGFQSWKTKSLVKITDRIESIR
jgi:hypothetical protein